MSADVCANLLTEAQSAIGPMGGYGHDALAAQRRGDKRQAEHYRGMSNHAYDMVTDSLKAYRSCLDEEMKAAKREPSAASRG
jgi:hypothetical protein